MSKEAREVASAEAYAVAEDVCSGSNIVSHDGYYEIDTDAAALIIQQYGDARVAKAEARIVELEGVLAHIAEYWNRDRNDTAMYDACWHAINEAEQALERRDHLARTGNEGEE